MGCSFSQNTYLYSHQSNMAHSLSKPNHQRCEGNEISKIKGGSNLRITNKIYAENYFSANNSLLETDRDMCSFMKKTQKNLQKSNLCNYQTEASSKRVLESEIEKNKNSTNSTKRSDTLDKDSQSANQLGEDSWRKVKKQMYVSDRVSQNSRKMIESQLILQQVLKQDERGEHSDQPQMLTFNLLESISLATRTPKKQQKQQQIGDSMMERPLFLNSNKNAKHKSKKKPVIAPRQNQEDFAKQLYLHESQIELQIQQGQIAQPYARYSNTAFIRKADLQSKGIQLKKNAASDCLPRKHSKAVAKTQRRPKKLL